MRGHAEGDDVQLLQGRGSGVREECVEGVGGARNGSRGRTGQHHGAGLGFEAQVLERGDVEAEERRDVERGGPE